MRGERLRHLLRHGLDRIAPTFKLELMRRTLYDRSTAGMIVHSILQRRALLHWDAAGRVGLPPEAAKHRTIRKYAARFQLRVFIETGTFLGDTVYAIRGDFDRVVSIDLDPLLATNARRRFARNPHITILQGDSSRVLLDVLGPLAEPALFWLDAHWSGGITAQGDTDTPIAEELAAILRHPVLGHVILVDDARLFGMDPDYPTLEDIRNMVALYRPGWTCEEAEDIIRIHR